MSFARSSPLRRRIRAFHPGALPGAPDTASEPLLARFLTGFPDPPEARRAELIRRLEAAIRAERVRGDQRHRGYDLVRHARLVRLLAEVRRAPTNANGAPGHPGAPS